MMRRKCAQIFLGAAVCVSWWLYLVDLHAGSHASVWDNVIAIVLGLHLALTLMAGMAIKLW